MRQLLRNKTFSVYFDLISLVGRGVIKVDWISDATENDPNAVG